MNIAEILKDCPKGTKLYSPIYGDLILVEVCINFCSYPICCRKIDGNEVSFTKDGKMNTTDAEPTLFPAKNQRDWSKFGVTDQKSKHQFKPFDKVLVRDDDDQEWECSLFSHITEEGHYACVGSWWVQCIPYEGNEHLSGTTTRITMKNKEFDFHEIKTFADACEKLGMKEHLLTGSMGGDREAQGQAQALYKLLIIQKAMNNGVWRDKDGWSYYPYWVLYSKEEMERMSEEEKQRKGIKQLLSCADAVNTESSGVRCACASYRGAYTFANSGFPLCFNSEEAALYAAKQFEDLFFQYYGIKVNE